MEKSEQAFDLSSHWAMSQSCHVGNITLQGYMLYGLMMSKCRLKRSHLIQHSLQGSSQFWLFSSGILSMSSICSLQRRDPCRNRGGAGYHDAVGVVKLFMGLLTLDLLLDNALSFVITTYTDKQSHNRWRSLTMGAFSVWQIFTQTFWNLTLSDTCNQNMLLHNLNAITGV